jgi:hypothetical protein
MPQIDPAPLVKDQASMSANSISRGTFDPQQCGDTPQTRKRMPKYRAFLPPKGFY